MREMGCDVSIRSSGDEFVRLPGLREEKCTAIETMPLQLYAKNPSRQNASPPLGKRREPSDAWL